MPLLDQTNYVPKEKYARGLEIFDYARSVARLFSLYDKAYLQTAATKLVWAGETAKGSCILLATTSFEAKHDVLVVGPLQRPKIPVIQDIDKFQGHVFDSAREDSPYTGGSVHLNKLSRLADKGGRRPS